MTQPDPKYVSASKPVNRRTAKPASRVERANPLVQDRLAAKWASQHIKGRFGAPLAAQLQATNRQPQAGRISPMFIAGGVLAAVSALGLLRAAIQASTLFAGAGAFGLLAGAAVMFAARRSNTSSGLLVPMATQLFDADSLQAFDRALESIAADAPDAVSAALLGLKQQLLRVAELGAGAPVDEHFNMDDRLYLTELLRRYLPDSLGAYLMVPKNQRADLLLEHGETAVSLLLGQLQLLSDEVSQRESKLAKSKAENLLKQQRFLESKSRR